MSDDRQVDLLLREADQRRLARDFDGAIELARRALAIDPDVAHGHASLALALLGAKRLHGASSEIATALLLDGNDPFVHYAAATIRFAERDLAEAWSHCLVALDVDAADLHTRILGARIRRLQHRHDEARALIREALELDGNSVEALTALAALELDQGNLVAAAAQIELALTAAPEDHEAHLTAGAIALARGDTADAEEHARFVLGETPSDPDAMRLWIGVKAHRNWFLGLWWRINAVISLRGERSQVILLVGSFFIANLAIILAGAVGWDVLERAIYLGWTAFCAYTWVAPTVFRWMVERELGKVVLNPDY